MRDPNRIHGILEDLERLWKKYPDLRLGQLLENAKYGLTGEVEMRDLFYLEDEELISILIQWDGRMQDKKDKI